MTKYRKDPRINQSSLKMFLQHDPAIARHMLAQPSKGSEAMKLGTLVHAIIELQGQLPCDFETSPYDSYRTKEAREWKKEKEASGVTIVTTAVMDQAQAMARSVLDDTPGHLKKLINNPASLREQEYYDANYKALLDLVSPCGTIGVDYKTTAETSLEGFKWSAKKYMYHLQAYHYTKLANLKDFYYVAVSSVAPYPVWCLRCSDEFIDRGEALWLEAVDRMNGEGDDFDIEL
jgi:hypothetical protein